MQGLEKTMVFTIDEYMTEMAKCGTWLSHSDLVFMAQVLNLNIILVRYQVVLEFIDCCYFADPSETPFFLIRLKLYILLFFFFILI